MRPPVVRSVRGIKTSSRRMHTMFLGRYGHLVGHHRTGLTLDRAIGLALCRRDVSERLHQFQDLLHRVTQAAPAASRVDR